MSSGIVMRLNPLLRGHGFELVRCGGTRPWSHRINRPVPPAPFSTTLEHESRSRGEGRHAFEIPIERCTTRYLFSYAPDGWHPLVAAVQEGLAGIEDVLGDFYSAFQPRTLDELFSGADGGVATQLRRLPAHPMVLGRLWNMSPWLLQLRLRQLALSKVPFGQSIYLGPQRAEDVRAEAQRLFDLYRSIAVGGYQPSASGHRIAGFFLVRGDDYRFVLCSGNHRVAVLQALGYTRCTATFMPGWPYAVNYDQLFRWTTVNGGVYEPEVARWLFTRYFEVTGHDVAVRLGLLR